MTADTTTESNGSFATIDFNFRMGGAPAGTHFRPFDDVRPARSRSAPTGMALINSDNRVIFNPIRRAAHLSRSATDARRVFPAGR
jgi:hypothetical protein